MCRICRMEYESLSAPILNIMENNKEKAMAWAIVNKKGEIMCNSKWDYYYTYKRKKDAEQMLYGKKEAEIIKIEIKQLK